MGMHYLIDKLFLVLPALIFLYHFNGHLKRKRVDSMLIEKLITVLFMSIVFKFINGIYGTSLSIFLSKSIVKKITDFFSIFRLFPSMGAMFYMTYFLHMRGIPAFIVTFCGIAARYFYHTNHLAEMVLAVILSIIIEVIGNRIFYKKEEDFYGYRSIKGSLNK